MIRSIMEGVVFLLHNLVTAQEAGVYVDTLNSVGSRQ